MALSILAGLLCGIISGLGIGGGSILMVWMTAFVGLEQRTAQGINLLYFLPTAAASLFFHIKNRFVDWSITVPAAISGSACAALCAFLAQKLDNSLLRQLFGGFLLVIGFIELRKALKKENRKT